MLTYIWCSLYRVKTEDDTQQYFQDDPELPVFSCVSTPYKSHRLINILLDDSTDKRQVCGVQPLGVTENATFIINLDHVRFDDLKADDVGSWKPTGTKHTYFCFNDAGETMYSQGVSHAAGYYNLTRRYYVHGTCPTFHRLIVSIEGIYMYIYIYILCTGECTSLLASGSKPTRTERSSTACVAAQESCAERARLCALSVNTCTGSSFSAQFGNRRTLRYVTVPVEKEKSGHSDD